MTESERTEKINEIVSDCNGSYDYQDFSSDCVREVVSKWSDENINSWFGESLDDENEQVDEPERAG